MKIAIYLNNEKISNVDCSDMEKGNPGIGGTEYCILLLAQMYKKIYPENEVILIARKKGNFPSVDHIYYVDNVLEVPLMVNNIGAQILIMNAFEEGAPLETSFFEKVHNEKVKTILWGHNFYFGDLCKQIAQEEYVRANVFVGRQQYDRYIDHDVINKSIYIYNMYPHKQKLQRIRQHTHNVAYIGSLVPAKGFHVLARAWKKILCYVPDAELYVIGGGNLYARNAELGKFGLAEENYENYFMSYLVDNQGEVLPSVHFLGVLGSEKETVIANTSVGVVNPTGRTETFGISALDFESAGVPVVTIAKGGFLDTVVNKKTGLLYTKEYHMAKSVSSLLLDSDKNREYGDNACEYSKKFLPSSIIKQWNALFEKVVDDKTCGYQKPVNYLWKNFKWVRIVNRNMKRALRIKKGFAMIDVETAIWKMIRRVK